MLEKGVEDSTNGTVEDGGGFVKLLEETTVQTSRGERCEGELSDGRRFSLVPSQVHWTLLYNIVQRLKSS